MRKCVRSLSVAALATIVPNPAHAGTGYAFTRIADDTAIAAEIGVAPAALNDAGQVAFMAGLEPGPVGVFVGSGGPLTTVADTSGEFRRLGFGSIGSPLAHGFASIDGGGQVTFGAVTQASHAGYFAEPGDLTIADSTLPFVRFEGDVFSSGSGPMTTFEAVVIVNQRPRQAILVGNGGPLTSIADTSQDFVALDLDPRVNASGQVAFHGTRRDGSEGIFVGNGGPPDKSRTRPGPSPRSPTLPRSPSTGAAVPGHPEGLPRRRADPGALPEP